MYLCYTIILKMRFLLFCFVFLPIFLSLFVGLSFRVIFHICFYPIFTVLHCFITFHSFQNVVEGRWLGGKIENVIFQSFETNHGVWNWQAEKYATKKLELAWTIVFLYSKLCWFPSIKYSILRFGIYSKMEAK